MLSFWFALIVVILIIISCLICGLSTLFKKKKMGDDWFKGIALLSVAIGLMLFIFIVIVIV